MNSFYTFLPLITAFSWANSGLFLRKTRTENHYVLPVVESSITMLVCILLITLNDLWKDLIYINHSTLGILIFAYVLDLAGTLLYIFSIRRTPLGIVYVLIHATQVMTITIIDTYINNLSFGIFFLLGIILILSGISTINFQTFKRINESKFNLIGMSTSIFGGFIWGNTAFIVDRSLLKTGILSAVFIKCCVILIIQGSVIFNKRYDLVKTLNLRELKFLSLSGACITFAYLLWVTSLKYNSGTLTSVLVTSSPIFVLILSYIFLKEKLSIYQISGIFICLTGIVAIVLNN